MADERFTRITVQALPTTVDKPLIPPLITVDRTDNAPSTTDFKLLNPSSMAEVGAKRRRGRPPKNLGTSPVVASSAAVISSSSSLNNTNNISANAINNKRSKKEEEDVCFICFDGGSLVLCDRRDCPKAYHPACVKRDDAFFRRSMRWNCGWHLCNFCQRNALFMCYTCPYSLCKGCVKQADILRVRGNKGFCRTCMTTVMLIENIPMETKEQVQVDFDDSTSWEYLFKVYWIYLKEKEALTIDELTRATNPWKVSALSNNTFQQKRVESGIGSVSELCSSNLQSETNGLKRRKTRKQPRLLNLDSQHVEKPDGGKVSGSDAAADWASKELLEFIAHMKNGETSVLSQFDVQNLLLDYIRKNNLRDPRQKCQIICDKRLENLFGKERVGHFEMLKLLEYHFKEESRTNGVIRGAAVDPLVGQLENEVISGDIQASSRETRRQSRKKAEEKGRQIKLDCYAAIDVHNINLIYLKRSWLENLMLDADNFHDKVVGSVVRIRISSNDQKQDMHRLVRIIGTSKAVDSYNVGDRTHSFMLKILNLNKMEDISINAISDQEFSEDECRRLRQSIKLGLVERMTVGEIQEKAMALQTVRVNDWLKTEIQRLNHLRDRASEMGHRKELRECVEKIELLKAPEERERRIHEIPNVHSDPRMDPSYGSDDDSGESDIKKQDGSVTPKYSHSNAKGAELVSPVRPGDILKDNRIKPLKISVANGDRKRKNTKFHVGKFDSATRPLESSHKFEKTDAASRVLEELNNRADPGAVSGNRGVTATISISQAASDSAKTTVSSRMLLVSDISELERIWHYQDPYGKVQGPFCMLQLRKWDSNRFFPIDLRVWKVNETPDQSILLTDALMKQQSSNPEPNVAQRSCLQSYFGIESDDKKVSSVEELSCNSDAPSVTHKSNDEGSNKNLADITATSEADDPPTQDCNGHLVSDNQGSVGQSSGLDIKARLIESLFATEEPSATATPTGSSETMHVTLEFDSSHPSTSTSKSDNADTESQAVRSQPSSPNAGRLDSETGWGFTSSGANASDLPSSTPESNPEDLKEINVENKHHFTSNVSTDVDASCATGSSASEFSHLSSFMPKGDSKDPNEHDAYNKHLAASAGYEQNLGTSSTVTGGINLSMLQSPTVANDGLKPSAVDTIHSVPSNTCGRDSEVIWSSVRGESDISVLPSNKSHTENMETHTVDHKRYNVPGQDSGTSWSSITGGLVFSDPPSTALKLESNSLDTPAVGNEACVGPNIPGHNSGTSWSSMSTGLGFSDLPNTSLKLEEASGGQAVGNKNPAVSNVPGQGSCISWSTASSLVGGEVHLPDVASDWGAYSTVHAKPVDEFHSGLVSTSSTKLGEVTSEHITPTLSCQLTNPHCDTSSWQPIELSTLGDESVSDLLSEVEAMESLRGMSSPTSRMHCGDDSLGSPGDDCFSPLGLSPNIDAGKHDSLSSTADMHFHVQSHVTDQSHTSFTVIRDLPRTSCILSIGDAEMNEVKPAIVTVPLHNFVSDAPVSAALSPSPPPPPLPPASLSSSPPSQPPPASLAPSTPPPPHVSLPPPLPPPASFSSPQPSSLSPKHKPPASLSPPPPPPPSPPASLSPPPPPPPTSISPPPPPPPASLPPPPPPPPASLSPPPPPPPASLSPPPPPLPSTSLSPPPPPPPTSLSSPPPPSLSLSSPPPPPTSLSPPPPPPPPASSPALPPPPPEEKPPSPPPQPPPSKSNRNFPSSPREEGELDPTSILVPRSEAGLRHQPSPQIAGMKVAAADTWKQGSPNTSNGWEPPGHPSGKFSNTGSILGNPNMHWNAPGPAMAAVSANTHWSTSVASQGTARGPTQTSPRYGHSVGRHSGSKDRSHHHHGIDTGFSKSRPTSWNRQSSFGGGGGSSRAPPPRGQRVCKFYESGYCKKGASCKYLHP